MCIIHLMIPGKTESASNRKKGAHNRHLSDILFIKAPVISSFKTHRHSSDSFSLILLHKIRYCSARYRARCFSIPACIHSCFIRSLFQPLINARSTSDINLFYTISSRSCASCKDVSETSCICFPVATSLKSRSIIL